MFTPDVMLEQVKDSVFIVVVTVHSSRMFLIFWNLNDQSSVKESS